MFDIQLFHELKLNYNTSFCIAICSCRWGCDVLRTISWSFESYTYNTLHTILFENFGISYKNTCTSILRDNTDRHIRRHAKLTCTRRLNITHGADRNKGQYLIDLIFPDKILLGHANGIWSTFPWRNGEFCRQVGCLWVLVTCVRLSHLSWEKTRIPGKLGKLHLRLPNNWNQ